MTTLSIILTIILICYAILCVLCVIISRKDFIFGWKYIVGDSGNIAAYIFSAAIVIPLFAIIIAIDPILFLHRIISTRTYPWQWEFGKKEENAPKQKQPTEEECESKPRLLSAFVNSYHKDVCYDGKRNNTRRYVYYVEEEYNPELNDFFKRNYDKINEIFASRFGAPEGYEKISEYEGNLKFVYLPLSEIGTLNEYMSEPKCHNESDRENFIREFYGGIFDNSLEEQRLSKPLFPIPENMSGLAWFGGCGRIDCRTTIKPVYEYDLFDLKYTSDDEMFEKIRNILLTISFRIKIFSNAKDITLNPGRIFVPYDENFLPNKFQVIYIEDNYNENNNDFFIRNNEKVKKLFRTEHAHPYYDFLYHGELFFSYLPLTITNEQITEFQKYHYPNTQNITQDTESIARELVGNIYSFFTNNLYINKNLERKRIAGLIRFKEIVFLNDTPENGSIGKPYFMFSYRPLDYGDDKSFFKEIIDFIHSIGDDGTMYSRRYANYNPEDEHDPNCADNYFCSETLKLVEEIKERVDRLKAMGYNTLILQKLMLTPPKLSRLHITADYRIMLTDYDKEIKMTPLPKAVFFFFLRHPEGVIFKHLIDYKDELLEIYKNLTVSEDEQKIKESIDSITDSTKNSINEKCSRIREAFIKEICEDLAENYFITQDHKSNAEPRLKLITLDRTMVSDDSGIL